MSALPVESLLTVREVAEMCSVAERTVRGWVGRGVIPFVKLGGSLRFYPSEINEWITNSRPAERISEPVAAFASRSPRRR